MLLKYIQPPYYPNVYPKGEDKEPKCLKNGEFFKTGQLNKGLNKKTWFFRVYTRFLLRATHAASAYGHGFEFNFFALIFQVFLNF
jgi:hypothetical protein